jgi:hypothetical protein
MSHNDKAMRDETNGVNLDQMSVRELLKLHGQTLAELRRRDVVRTANAPAGDYAEWLVAQTTSGELAGPAQKGWDVCTPEGGLLQVKARLVSDPRNRSQRQMSPFRSWEFHSAVFVLFDQNYVVLRAACLPADTVSAAAKRSELVNGDIVFATDEFLDRGEDWTPRLTAVTSRDAAEQTSGNSQRVELADGGWEVAAMDAAGNVIEITTYDATGAAVLRAYGTPPEGGFVWNDDVAPQISEDDRLRVACMSTCNLAVATQRAEAGDVEAQQWLRDREAWVTAQRFTWGPGDVQSMPPEGEQS